MTTGERRAHLFAHRIGLAFSIIGIAGAVLFILGQMYDYVSGFERRAQSYLALSNSARQEASSAPIGPLSAYGTKAYYLSRSADERMKYDEIMKAGRFADLEEYFYGIALAFIAAAIFYTIVRTLGWIVASLFA